MEKPASDKEQVPSTKKKSAVKNEERKAQLDRERLQRETRMGKQNNHSLRQSWRLKMTNIEIPAMREKTKVSRNIFDRTLDIKQSRVDAILEALDEAEEQYKRNIAGHIEAIGRLEVIYEGRLSDIWRRFKVQLMETIKESVIDRNQILSMNNESETKLELLMAREQHSVEELLEKIQSEASYRLDNLREEGEHSIKMILVDVEGRINHYHQYLESIVAEYTNNTHQRRTIYESLKVKDTKDGEIIASQLLEIAELVDTIQKYQEEVKNLKDNVEDATLNINIEKNLFARAYLGMSQRFHNEQTIDKNQLTHMTKEFKFSVKELRRLVKKARTVISLIRICRKFETHVPDKLLPVQLHRTNDYLDNFQKFWYRAGVLELETIVLKKQKSILLEENARLKEHVKSRMASLHPTNFSS